MLRLPGQIDVVAVGKLRTGYWLAAQAEYLKRLQRYVAVSVNEVRDVAGRTIPDEVALQREGEQLLKASAPAQRRILLSPTGSQLSSEQLATFLHKQVSHYGRIAFLIGGPLGFSPELIASSHEQLSLSPLTFPHELARVILLEQLYRACTILNNEQYHK